MKNRFLLTIMLWLSLLGTTWAQSNALHFDGTSDYVALPNFPTDHDFSQGFTFTAWVKWDVLTGNARLFEVGNGLEIVNNSIILRINEQAGLILQSSQGTNGNEIETLPNTAKACEWVHIAATINTSNEGWIYVNGFEAVHGTVYTPLNEIRENNWLGKSAWSSDNYFSGTMDEVSIWNTHHTQIDIQTIMKYGLTGSETNLIAYYQFDQGTADGDNSGLTSLMDKTSNNLNGTLTNFALTSNMSNWVEGVTLRPIEPLSVTITKTDNTQITVSNAVSLEVALVSIPLSEVKMLEITDGYFLAEDWLWLQLNRHVLDKLTHFTITNGATLVANIPDQPNVNPFFYIQIEEVNLTKLESIGQSGFDYDRSTITKESSLTSVGFPNVVSLGKWAFYDCNLLTNMLLGATPPSVGEDAFFGLPTPRYLAFADVDGNLLIGAELESARAAYKSVDDGNTSDDLWYGWDISRNLSPINIDHTISNGVITAENTEAKHFGGYTEGATITITATPEDGYILFPGSLRVYKTGDESIVVPVANGKFTMPAFDVTVSGEFVSDKLQVAITKTDNTVVASNSTYTLQDAIGSIPLGEVKKIVISGGTFTYINWDWLKANRSNLNNLTHFVITDRTAVVADMPDTYNTSPHFGAQLQELKVARMSDVGDYVLYYCTSLTTLDLPDVTRIKARAFMGCSSLVNVNIPKINQIYAEAFENCTSLTNVIIPNAFNIGVEAFNGCTQLSNLILRAMPPISYVSAFAGCPTPRYLAFADVNGNLLTGTELENVRAAYKGVNDGDTTDDLWYGWVINRNLYVPGIDPAMVNGSLTASNPEAEFYGLYPAGAIIFITSNPAAGYKLTPGSLRVYKTGNESVEVSLTGNSFTMPDFEVTVTALFEPLPLQVTFVAETSGNIPVGLVLESGAGRIAVDKGDGVLVPYGLDPEASFFYVMSYEAGNTAKIFSDNITMLAFQNPLKTLDVSRVTTLTQLICPNTQLNFATLPQPKSTYTWYWYSPQQNLEATCTNGVVDLSSQFTALDVAGSTQNTVYTWFLSDGTALVKDDDYVENDGVFTFIKMPISTVYCKMTNAAFPDLSGDNALCTVDITVDAVASIPIFWTGDISTDWQTNENWSSSSVPTSATDVTISAGKNVVIGPTSIAECNNLTIEPSGSLTIQSSVLGTGSLKVNGMVTGAAIVQRYLTSGGWRLIASPVTGQTVGDFLASTGTTLLANPNDNTNKAMKDYNETNNAWNGLAYFTNTATQMGANKGYAVWPATDGAVSFTGTLQTGSINVDVMHNGNGWNCIGNPYTSAIAINSNTGQSCFINENSSNIEPSYAAIYLWEHASNSYTIINNESTAYYAAVGQAFFIKAATGASQVSFAPALQCHQTGTTFKSAGGANPSVVIEATQKTNKSLATVKFISNCTPGLDFGYDAGAMKTGFDVFTRLVEDNGVDFALQCLPSIGSEGYPIPVGIETTEAGKVTLKFTPQNLPANHKLMFEDRLNGTHHEVSSNNPIVADVTAGTTLGRFYLSVVNTTSSKAPLAGKVFVSQVNGRIVISGTESTEASASLYDVRGRRINAIKLKRGMSNEIETNGVVNGVYLLKIEDQGMVQTMRIRVNNE